MTLRHDLGLGIELHRKPCDFRQLAVDRAHAVTLGPYIGEGVFLAAEAVSERIKFENFQFFERDSVLGIVEMHAKFVEVYTSASHRSGLSGPPCNLNPPNTGRTKFASKLFHSKMLNEKHLDIVNKSKRTKNL